MTDAGEIVDPTWEYTWVGNVNMVAGERTLNARLAEGWEPFAASSDSDDSITVHLRRLSLSGSFVEPPHPLEIKQ